ncbi:MAG: UvrD-helicase domain-containing protein [Alphaproteobacteria bacterium]|nr:UvrD-helicase domain-containing protein [Alphaproteobacteria bacterium]
MIDVNKEQRRASNPTTSVWVSASAGSGKTKVLTDRVLNLLLLSGRPEKILCLTFTKTAAAEMTNRINKVLKSWVIMSEEDLKTEISKLIGDNPTQVQLERARRLFALTLETPGGMKIMTIHSFSQSILKRFPLEAGINPHFEVMDDTTANDILSSLINEAFKNTSLKSSIEELSSYLDENALIALLKETLSMRHRLLQLTNQSSLNSVINNIKKYFNINNYHSEKQIIKDFFKQEEWDINLKKYLTTKFELRAKYIDDKNAINIYETYQKIKALKVVQATQALLELSFYIIELYENYKKISSLLDYDDLINYTQKLLSESGNAAWVLYKLDGGIDHILVDEAQDTNPLQWSIIRMLAEEFFSGIGANDYLRTIFAVGDKKQSIYSFQGADPDEFERMRQYFEERVKASKNEFDTVPFNFSFRSTEPILRLVNFVLRNPQARYGILPSQEDGTHLAYRAGQAGLVEIWPLEESKENDTSEEWKPPVERTVVQSPITRLAEKIAIKIKYMIDSKEILESKGRPIQAGDFLILVQRRKKFVSELVRFLKEYQIPVAGVDRLILTNYIAIQDLIGLAKFTLLPDDDLNLAEILKSPLLHLTEDDLYNICYNRENKSVYERVCELYPKTAEFLQDIMDKADKMPLFEFFSYILSVKNGRKNFQARLGNEVNEALDEFLNLILTYEQNNIPSLQSFLKWIGDKEIEIKRDLDQGNLNAVRIMTVHGSKGLQGNIVFLPDTRFIPSQKPKIIWTENNLPIWTPQSSLKTSEVSDLQEQWCDLQMQEYHRLLYVAITRPMDRLYICGWNNKSKAKAGNWYDLIKESLPYQADSDGIIRFSCNQDQKVLTENNIQKNDSSQILPDWVWKKPAEEPIPSQPIRPSISLIEECSEQQSLSSEMRSHSLKRGTFIHKLLQYLPNINPDRRKEVALKMKPDDIDIPDNLFQLFDDERFKLLFGSTSLAEVPIVGILNGQVVSGQIDRLVVLEKEILLVDYKSNYHVPQNENEVSLTYKKQLKTYEALLKNIFPDKVIKSYLLWTQNLTWMEIK